MMPRISWISRTAIARVSVWLLVAVVICITAVAQSDASSGPPLFSGTVLPEVGDVKASPSPGHVTSSGKYPGEAINIQYWWTKEMDAGESATFTVNVSYPSEFVGYSHANPVENVDACVHVPEEHKVRCTGTFPAPSSPQTVTGSFTLHTVATCGLYPSAPANLNYPGTVVFSDGSQGSGLVQSAVARPLQLDTRLSKPRNGALQVPISSNGLGPVLEWWQYYGNYRCSVTFALPDFADITYKVYLRQQGGAWRSVTNGYLACSMKVPLNPNELSCLDSGDPGPYEWRVDAIDLKYQDCRDPESSVSKFTTGSCQPEVSLVPQYGDYFLSGLNVPNKYRAEVYWHGSAYPDPPTAPYGQVVFDLNGNVTEVPGKSWGAEKTYNMGEDFNIGLTGGDNQLLVKAVNSEGDESLETIVEPMVFPVPAWITQFAMGSFDVDLKSKTVSYSRGVEYPNPHFEAKYEVPSWVPYLGGADIGIIETFAAVGAEAKSDGSGSANVKGNTGVQVSEDKQVLGNISGAGSVQIRRGKGLDLTEASLGLGIEGSISEEMGIADLVPGLKAAEKWWLVGRLVKWFNKRATVEGSIGPSIDIQTKFENKGSGLEFNGGTGTGKLAMVLKLSLRVLESLKSSVEGGGTPEIVVQVPAGGPWGYLKQIAIRLYAKATLTVWRFEGEWERGITCALPTGKCESDEGEELAQIAVAAWRLMGREYATENYATFVANRPVTSSAQSTQETPIVTNVFPLSNPALAVRADGERMILWVHDDTAKPLAQGEEIQGTHWNGSTWTTSPLTADNVQDFAPQVAFDDDGDAVAVWERTNTVHISPTLDLTYTQSFEIATAVWLSSTETWSVVTELTADDLLDISPQLPRGQDGTLMAMWRTGDGTDLLGTASHPVTFTYAVWDGSTWGAPAAATGGLTNVLGVDTAVYSATQAALVMSRDGDGDLLTGGDTELSYVTWDGANWSGLTALTSDAISDTGPSLAYDSTGQPVIVWLRGSDLVMQVGWGGSPEVLRAGSTAGSFLDTELVGDPGGNLALLWQAQAGNKADAAYAVYDAVNGVWGSDNTLMSDRAVEESFAPAFGSDGTLYLAYNKVTMETVTKSVEISPTLTITVSGVPKRGQTDLYFLSHSIGRDLAIEADGLFFSTANPAPGSSVTIEATVYNLGDLAVTGGQVAFYDGDPHGSGTQIGSTQALESPFRAATTDTVSVVWNVPAGAVAHTVYAVADPAGSITESNEANNVTTLGAVLPDLSIAWALGLQSGDPYSLTASITNDGHSAVSTPFEVAFRANDPGDGTLIGSVPFTETLEAGTNVEVTLPVTDPAALTGLGSLLWVIADRSGDVAEGDETNNTDFAALGALPDVTVFAFDIKEGIPVSVTVRNIGAATATDVRVTGWPAGSSTKDDYQDSIAKLEPGEAAAVIFDVEDVVEELWVRVDADDLIVESDETNNVARRGVLIPDEPPPGPQQPIRVYLPMIAR